jgi:N-acetylglucosaminyldiphosphoundecaprenol N-acetyl-beta-D-mannosaminyltransferase
MTSSGNPPAGARFDVIGNRITVATRASALRDLLAGVRAGQGGYVCFVNAHVAVTGREDPRVRAAVNESFMSLPDGRPVFAAGRLQGIEPLEAVPGPDFMEAALRAASHPPLRHFFLGGRQDVLDRLVAVVGERYPGACVAGALSPPFRALSPAEWGEVTAQVRAARPDVVWVGLGAPKQELFMREHWRALAPAVLLGVGAAFDFTAGAVGRAPAWMRSAGLEWLFRLVAEPRRLWRRYAYTNTMFLAYLAADTLRRRRPPA